MNRTGNFYDNAVVGRILWSLKHKCAKHESFAALETVRLSVLNYVDTD